MLEPRSARNGTWNENFFISFLACPDLVWLEIKLEWHFKNFFTIILGTLQLGSRETVSEQFFFSLFLPVPAWFGMKWRQKNVFKFFNYFHIFFWIFLGMLQPKSSRDCTWYENFFYLFFGLSHPSLAWNEAQFKIFFFWIILLFVLNFFGNVPALVRQNWFPEWNFFTPFSSCPGPIYLKMKLEWSFLNFPIFLGMLKPKSGRNGFRNKNFFLSFLACPNPICLEMKPK